MVDAEEMQDGGVQVMHVHGILGHIVAEVVGLAVTGAGLHAAAGHPHGEATRVVVAAGFGAVPFALAGDAAAELAAPDDERVLEQPATFEVFDQGGAGLVGITATRGAPGGESAMVIPVRVEELHEADAAFDQATGEDAIGGVAARTPRIRPIELEDFILLVA